MSNPQPFTPSFTDTWTASFENPGLLSSGSELQFYYDGNINIGFGYNLTSHHNAAARTALAAVGIVFTNSEWSEIVKYASVPSNHNTTLLNNVVHIDVTSTQALELLDNYDNTVVIPGLEHHIGNFNSLPALTQTALEDVYYDHSTLLGPRTYSDATAGNLVGVCEEICFATTALYKISSNNSGLEERFLSDGLLAIGVKVTSSPYSVISSLDESNASTTNIAQFLEDVLIGTNHLGSSNISANHYVQLWGGNAETSFQNITSLLDKYLVTNGEYVAATDTNFANIDSYNIAITGNTFTLYNAGSYHGTISNFAPGTTLDLASITATGATLGASNVLTVQESGGKSITLNLDPSQNYSGDTFAVASDGHGGTGITISAPVTITFSEYALGTFITNQYQNKGIIFGGDLPFIATDISNPTSPVLSGTPLFHGAITGTFVDPKTGAAATVKEFSLDAGYFDTTDSTQLTWYDASGNKLGSAVDTIIGIQHFDIVSNTPIASWGIAEVGSEPNGFAIDNVSFNTPTAVTAPVPIVGGAALHSLIAGHA